MLDRWTASPSPHRFRVTAAMVALLCLVAVSVVQAEVIERHYEFTAPVITETGEYQRVQVDGGWHYGAPGEPVLPMIAVRLLLPPGEEIVELDIVAGESIPLPGRYTIEPGPWQSPLTGNVPSQPLSPAPQIYNSEAPVPGRLFDPARISSFRGYRIVTLALHPVQYRPASGELSYLRDCVVRITTAPDTDRMRECGEMIRHDKATLSRLHRLIDNPGDSASYSGINRIAPKSRDLDPALGFRYLIITTESWYDRFAMFADFLTRRGLPTGVYLNSWIQANYTSGVDEQENIRSFVVDAYQTWDIDYLLLGGDARDGNGIPHRGLYASTDYFESDGDIPADLYYGCLDGNWNRDGDGLWGEVGEADLYHEVAVGRVCVGQPTDLSNFITKTMRYLSQPVSAECNAALMVGELLWSEPTWGGDYKDEIKDGSSAHGYTTAGFPATMLVDTLYDRDASWTVAALIDRLNTGSHIINHMGHCLLDKLMRFSFSDVPLLENNGLDHTYNFFYSQGCYAGSFDNRGPSGIYGMDCIGEAFQGDDGGPVAMILNSRDGWGVHGGTNGSSQYYDREFFDALFGEGITAIGNANDDSKMDTIWNIDYGANRYCYYTINLFGDPSLQLWTATPTELTVIHPETIYIGEPNIPVTVLDEYEMPVGNAQVSVFSPDLSIYDTGLTDGSGQVMLHPVTEAPGTLQFVVTASNHLTFGAEVVVEEPAGAHVVFDSVIIHDTGWEMDGRLDAGEQVLLELSLHNIGVLTASGLILTIECDNPEIEIMTDYITFPDIPPDAVVTGPMMFEVALAGDTADQENLSFEINVISAQGIWETGFEVVAEAPVLLAGSLFINDCEYGNCNGSPDPGEPVVAGLWVINEGHSNGRWLTGTLTSVSNEVMINGAEGSCQLVPEGGTALISSFSFEVVSDAPSGTFIPFHLELESTTGYTTELSFGVIAGTWFDDGETDRGWTLGVPGDDASTGIWTRVDPVGTFEGGNPCQPEDDHSPDPGTFCFVTGNGTPGGPAGEVDVDNGKTTMLSPVFNLNGKTSAIFSYWRWYTNNLGANPGQDYWRVQATNDGINWEMLENTLSSNATWSYQSFELHNIFELTSAVQIRFIAEDILYPSLVEAAVDDITLMALEEPFADVDDNTPDASWGITACGPNPLRTSGTIQYRLPAAGSVRLALFDLNGRVVHTLINGVLPAGTHSASLSEADLSHLSTGIYFLRLETPDLKQLKQISVLK